MNDHENNLDGTTYQVVRNDDGQYSIWAVGRALPAGWQPCDVTGDKATCLNYIERTWTDMRPLHLQRGSPPDSTGA